MHVGLLDNISLCMGVHVLFMFLISVWLAYDVCHLPEYYWVRHHQISIRTNYTLCIYYTGPHTRVTPVYRH